MIVDVVGVIGNFECMVCIVDGIGILLDKLVVLVSVDI